MRRSSLLRRASLVIKSSLRVMKKLAIYGAVLAISWMYISTSLLLNAGLLFVVYLVTGGWQYARAAALTIRRDLFALYCLVRFKLFMKRNIKRQRNVPVIFQDVVKQYPRKIALQWESVKWTFSDLEEYSNTIGNHFYDFGLRRGDTVAVFVTSRPEFVSIWLGLSKIGVISALINFNLRGDALAHCINIAAPSVVIVSADLVEHLNGVKGKLKGGLKYYSLGAESQHKLEDAVSLDPVLSNGKRTPPPKPKDATYFDRLVYIYTSGTTGLPKAAVITHNRFIYMCTMPHYILRYKKSDVVYCSLPLYHSNGGIVGLGQCLLHGLTFTFRSKFSASNFWLDCIKFNATVVLYIGEICRYLLAQPHRATDRQHRVRMATGNGLRREIWSEFVSRFNIDKVGEFYGATEGNANLINIDNKVGSCGFVSVIAPFAYPVKLIRVDDDCEFIRGPDGLCVPCAPYQQGMAIGKIVEGNATQSFDGYADAAASRKKIVTDVQVKGDKFFVSGDILEWDELGYMYFRDRTGDTFRWKAENVSTAECEARIAKVFDRKLTVAVYGVTVPLNEGKAGMACIEDPEKIVDFDSLYHEIEAELPSYARPLFVRQTDKLELTSTHKLKKVGLVKEGYDINSVTDPIYFFDASKKKYVPLDTKLYDTILEGTARV